MPDLDMMGGGMPQKPDNHEAAMARADLYKAANYSFKLFKMIQDGQELEGWVQAKITKAADYIASVYHYMEYEMKFNDYGKKLEDSDIYTESVKQQFIQKLTEARVKLEKLKEKNIADLEEGWDDMIKAGEKRKAEKGTGKFDSKKTSTGTVYTRKASTFDDGGKDSDTKKAEKKAKSKSVKEAAKPDFLDMDKDGDRKEPMKKAVADKKKNPFAKKTDESVVSEKAVSKAQQKFFGMVHAAKKGEKPASKEVAKVAKGISGKEAEKFASTKHKGLPDKVEEATGGYSAKDARAGKDLGKPGKNFAKIADKAGKAYGSKERGEKVAGAVLAKLRKG